MEDVIQFERIKDVSGWSLHKIRDYVKDNGWKGFKIVWEIDEDTVLIERTT